MQDDSAAPGREMWREIIDRHQTALADEITAKVDAEIGSSVTAAVKAAVSEERERSDAEIAKAVLEERTRASDETRRRLSESLNQTLRRIRKTTAEHETLQLLLEDSASCAERAVVVLIENNQAQIGAWRGTAVREEEEDTAPIDLAEASAIALCVESKDPVVALAAPAEISAALCRGFGQGSPDQGAGEKIYLFPITARQYTVAVMLATGTVIPAPIELLCEAAGMKLESLEVAAKAVAAGAPLVQIASVEKTANPVDTPLVNRWTSLTPEEQALHLRAQRTAKVKVAQIRISESEALRRGVQARDIYGALRPSIDTARTEYQQAYMSQTPTMVDYLHLEITRSLAHEDSRLLGQDYPGPIV